MSKNIKDIGKELMGKSLNSFHRKIGLTQLEKNNEIQDGILNGILSQVDDAYIEKTEQSNVMHLDGSGDGVVVLDGVEGNTMVNLATVKTVTLTNAGSKIISNITRKSNTKYTIIFDVTSNTATTETDIGIYLWTTSSATSMSMVSASELKGRCVYVMTSTTDVSSWNVGCRNTLSGTITLDNIMILEGDWTDKEIPPYFQGLQSSFEENVNGEGKYEVEVLSHKGRPNELKDSYKEYTDSAREYVGIHITDVAKKYMGKRVVVSGKLKAIGNSGNIAVYSLGRYKIGFYKSFSCSTNSYIDFYCEGKFSYDENEANGEICALSFFGIYGSGVIPIVKDIKIEILDDSDTILTTEWCPHYEDDETYWISHKNSNKIKILIDEPLRAVGNTKDRLRIKDGKLVVERKCGEIVLIGDNIFKQIGAVTEYENTVNFSIFINATETIRIKSSSVCLCDRILPHTYVSNENEFEHIRVDGSVPYGNLKIWLDKSKLSIINKESIKQWLSNNLTTVVYQLAEPYYEEVLNEYGEPIILEGYENGTLYIDSTIVPTTTIRYTPKMESLNTLSEVTESNEALTLDMNENIIPYMMDVDMLITEKEMSAISTYSINNIRKMEELDMTSMQKRTFDMLERLIRGDQYKKEYTKEEMINRVLLYENAGRITTEQALELNLIIEEVYGSN